MVLMFTCIKCDNVLRASVVSEIGRMGTIYALEANREPIRFIRGIGMIRCRKCENTMLGEEIDGKRNEGVRCTENCKRARRPKCRCSCGGEAHGVVWAI